MRATGEAVNTDRAKVRRGLLGDPKLITLVQAVHSPLQKPIYAATCPGIVVMGKGVQSGGKSLMDA